MSDTLHIFRLFDIGSFWISWCSLEGWWQTIARVESYQKTYPEIINHLPHICEHCKAEAETSWEWPYVNYSEKRVDERYVIIAAYTGRHAHLINDDTIKSHDVLATKLAHGVNTWNEAIAMGLNPKVETVLDLVHVRTEQ